VAILGGRRRPVLRLVKPLSNCALGTMAADHRRSAQPTATAMKPILVLQHLLDDSPGYLATWLAREGLPMEVRCTEAGQDFPESVAEYRALAILGGSMSANDEMPSLRRAEDLVRQAMAAGVPVIGHCLGGQLMARALGARIGSSAASEVGWQPMTVRDGEAARHWFGAPGRVVVFQWHDEAFALPSGAAPLASSAASEHQAFSIGPHLAMQFHIEIDDTKLRTWLRAAGEHLADAHRRHPSTVQSAEQMLLGMDSELAAHQALADRLYARWMSAAVG